MNVRWLGEPGPAGKMARVLAHAHESGADSEWRKPSGYSICTS